MEKLQVKKLKKLESKVFLKHFLGKNLIIRIKYFEWCWASFKILPTKHSSLC